MIGKITGLARALAILLAVIAGFVAIPGLNVPLVLVVLGLVAGISYCDDSRVGLMVTALALPVAATALAVLPVLGAQLSAVAGNVGLSVAAGVASSVAMRLFALVKGDVVGLSAK